MNRNKRPTTQIKIYALLTDKQVYVGKTSNKDLASVYRNHTRGRCGPTKDTIIANTAADVKMYIMEDIMACTSVAYRHVVAWVHIFAGAGYTSLNHNGTQQHAADLHPETQLLVHLLSQEPLDKVLERSIITTPGSYRAKAAHLEEERNDNNKPSSTKLTVRLSQVEKEAFDTLARHLNMSQRDTLMHLINYHTCSQSECADIALLNFQKKLQQKIKVMKAENEKLMLRLKRLQTTPETAAPKMTQRFRDVQAGIEAYFRNALPQSPGHPLPRANYKHFKRNHPDMGRFEYRNNTSPYILSPLSLLYGNANPPVHFWIGHTSNGTPCKIRIYEKADGFGVSPLNERFSIEGVQWLVQTRTAADGAEDLIFALPYIPAPVSTAAPSDAPRKKLSLDEQIAVASRKL